MKQTWKRIWAIGLVLALALGMLPGYAIAVEQQTTEPAPDPGTLLYFVDAGDYNPATVAEGESLGLYNSVTDQLFGEDAVTGYQWGLVSLGDNDPAEAVGESGQVKTKYQYSNNTFDISSGYAGWADGLTDILDNTRSLRYARDQGGVFSPYQISYGFTLPAGSYTVEVGFSNTWGNANSVEAKANGVSLGTAEIPNAGTGVISGTAVLEQDGVLRVDSLGYTLTLQVAYLKVYQGGEAGETPEIPDTPAFDPSVVDNAAVDTLLYFVDAGDYNTSTVVEGEALGLLNGKTDQLYGPDEKAGYSWGLQNLPSDLVAGDDSQPVGTEGQCRTVHQGTNNTFDIQTGYADWETGLTGKGDGGHSFRYAEGQDTAPTYLRYQFELPAGYYDLELGFSNTWGNAGAVKVTVNDKEVGTASMDTQSTAVIEETIRLREGESLLDLYCIGTALQVQLCYIKITKSDESRYEANEWETESGVRFETLQAGGYRMTNDYFEVEIGQYGQIRAIRLVGDEYGTNFVFNEENFPALGQSPTHQWMGEVMFNIQKEGESGYSPYYTSRSDNGRTIQLDGDKIVVTYENATGDRAISGFKVIETYQYVGDQLRWEITLENTSGGNLVVGDWGLPMPFNELLTGSDVDVYENRVIDHSFVGMDSSYLYAIRPNGKGSYLLFSPDTATGAKLEYADRWNSEHSGDEAAWAASGTWASGLTVYYIHSDDIKKTNSGYLSNSKLELAAGESKTYAFHFTGVADEAEMRSTLYEDDLIDMVAVPGFAYSVNMPGKIYLHTKVDKEDISISILCPHETNLHNYGQANNVYTTMEHTKTDANTYARYEKTVTVDGEQYHVYDLQFTEFGQHNLVVNYTVGGQAKQAVAQFYMMDTVANMLEDHAEFMVEKTQLVRPGKVGNALFDEWWINVRNNRITTFAGDGDGYFQMNYWGWGDDWGGTQAEFLAEKNAYLPKANEVAALDAYLDIAIWNELMREHQKDYRVHNFLMEAPNTSPDGRGYAYPHIYNTYFSMYKIASAYPDLVEYREEPETYLLRAYNIFCTQNSGSVGYGMNCGTMGESSVPDIIAALQQEGYYDEADKMLEIMRDYKYLFFENRLYPYGSEYSYDNTAEEGVYVAAKLAQEYGWYEDSSAIMTPEQRIADLDAKTRACRGMQPLWYFYANPVTICGEGWWNFQYTMSLAAVPMDDYLRYQDNGMTAAEKSAAERVNYAAKLGNLTCVNSGQICSDPETIGAVAWIYQSELGNYAEAGDTLYNGWRHRAGESGLNLFGAIRILSADVTNDPVFGLFGYGCEVSDNGSAYTVQPLDGINSKLHLIDESIYIELNRDQYTTATVYKDGTGFTMNIDSFMESGSHEVEMDVYGLQPGDYKVTVGSFTGHFTVTDGETSTISVPVEGNTNLVTVTREAAAHQLEVVAEADTGAMVSDTVELRAEIRMDKAFHVADATYAWNCTSANAANVTWKDQNRAVAKVKVSKAGTYTFQVSASVSGGSQVVETVNVTVVPDPAMKELVAQFTFEDETIDGKDAAGANLNNNATVNSVGDTMGETVLAANFLKTADGKVENGKAAKFTGSIKGGYLELSNEIFDRLENATISMDVCLDGTQGGGAALLDLSEDVKVYFTGANTLMLEVGGKTASTNTALASGFWKNVTLVASGDDYTLYLDGKACAALPDTGVNLSQLDHSKRNLLGRSNPEADAFFSGLMDNLTIRSRALSAEEVAGMTSGGAHTPLEAVAATVVTQVGTAPVLPAQINVLYTDGIYEMTDVTWEDVDEALYQEPAQFTVTGKINDTVSAVVTVYVVSGAQQQLEQLPGTEADSIMGNRSTSDGPSILITRGEPANSGDLNNGGWQNWGDASQNQPAWVSYEWATPKILASSEAYFFKDGNNNFFPASYTLEYLDTSGAWLPVETSGSYEVVLDGYSVLEFNPVVAKGIRLTMSPSKDGSGILKWKVKGWNFGLGVDSASLQQMIALSDKLLERQDSGLVSGNFSDVASALETARQTLNEIGSVEIKTESERKQYQAKVDAAEQSLSNTLSALQAKDNNIAFLADVSTSFVSSWESLDAVNDDIVNLGVDPAKPRYGSWGNASAFETITYTWAVPMELSETEIQFWTDNGGILAPAGYAFYQLDSESGTYTLIQEMTGTAATDEMLKTVLNGVTTTSLQVRILKQVNDGNGVGVMEWRVLGAGGETPEPEFVAVTGITHVPNATVAGFDLDLSNATVEPDNATNKTVIWSVKDAGTTGAAINGNIFSATAAGEAVITATIKNGAAEGDFTQDFPITVTAPEPVFVPVSDITAVPTSTVVGESLLLTAAVMPENATNKNITWSVERGSATLHGNVLTAAAAGEVVVKATIANGKSETEAFAKAFTITVTEAEAEVYTVTVVGSNHSQPGSGSYAPGETVTIKAGSRSGYRFAGWVTEDVVLDDPNSAATTFIMPEKDVTVRAKWILVPGTGTGGVKPPINTEPVQPDTTFTDVKVGDWYEEAVAYVAEEGLMTGVGNGKFNPDGAVTRAMVWTVLARMAGENTDGGATWYSKAQSWAMRTGVSDGTNPMAGITREQLAAMLYRFEGSPKVSGNLNAYPDASQVSDWAVDALVWATQTGLINGMNGKLSPSTGATRAQLAAMLMRLVKA